MGRHAAAAGLIKLARPKHWLKNVLVLAPLFFSGNALQGSLWHESAEGFLAFCAAASAVYVINDLGDAEKDRAHPIKRNRPIASGAVSPTAAAAEIFVLLAIAAALSLIIGSLSGAAILALYVIMNLAYSRYLKRVPIADVCILSAGYLMRVLYGGLACGIHVSSWLYLTVLCASFYMGLGKRRGEMDSLGDNAGTREVLSSYTREFLDKNMYMFLALANVFYALWARDVTSGMLATVPLVMILSMRYSLDVESASDGDPMEIIMADKWLIILSVILVCAVAGMIYLAE